MKPQVNLSQFFILINPMISPRTRSAGCSAASSAPAQSTAVVLADAPSRTRRAHRCHALRHRRSAACLWLSGCAPRSRTATQCTGTQRPKALAHRHTATQCTGTQRPNALAHSDPMHWHTATQCTGTQRPNALAHSDPMHWLTCAALDQQRATTGDAYPAAGEALHHGAPELAPPSRLPGRVPGTLNWRDKNRHDIGQSQSNWIACKMETPRSLPPLGHPPRRRAECSA
jgi:hypothetical protein